MKPALAALLVLCAMSATGVAQEVSCRDCDHVASYFKGEGGFIGTVAADAEAVTFLVACGNVTVTGEAKVEGGTAAELFNHRNGLACDRDGGSLEIAGLEDGGWYWITDEANSAVGSLLRQAVLGYEPVEITNPGDGVEMTMGRGAVYLRETATGRVGILPNILPQPLAPPADLCGPRITPNTNPPAYTSQQTLNCMLGDGGSQVRLQAPGHHGRTTTTTTVTRNIEGGAAINVTADLWLNESGSYSTADLSATNGVGAANNKGWIGKGSDNWLTDVGWIATLHGATPGADLAGTGVAIDDTDNDGQAEITVSPSATYCPTGAGARRATAVINILAFPDGTASATSGGSADDIHPGLSTSRALDGAHAATQLAVVCPPRSALTGSWTTLLKPGNRGENP